MKPVIIIAVFVLAFNTFGWLLCPRMALADPSTPDALQIRDVEVYRHVIETDDYLVVFLFNIEYGTAPDDPANDLFIFRMLDGDDTLGDSLPYSYGMNGYQYGVSAMYFSAAEAPTWGELYDIRIDGNPTEWASPPSVVYTLISADYSTATTQDEAQTELESWLIDATQDIEQNWNVPGELITVTNIGTVFTAAGQHYFIGAIPGCMSMAPDVFAIRFEEVDWPDDKVWTDTRASDTEDRFDGTTVDDFKRSLSNALGGIDAIYATTVLTLIGVLVLMGISFFRWASAEPVYGMVPLVLLLGSKMSFFPWELYALFIFASAAYVGYILIGKYASG